MKDRSIIIRLALGLAILLAVLVVLVAGLIVLDPLLVSPETPADVSNTSYIGTDGSSRDAYLARPAGDGPYPGIIMFHEWWGLNEEITELADELAAKGYIVLAPDVYRGQLTHTVPRAIWLRITTPDERVNADADAAYAHLQSLDGVDTQRLGAIGFCFGGGVSLHLATRHDDLAATVTLYGDLITEPVNLGELRADGSLFGIYGADDASIPLSEIRAFEEALETADVAHQVKIYPDVGHAFVQPDSIDQTGPAQRAWEDILIFFGEHLKGGGSTSGE